MASKWRLRVGLDDRPGSIAAVATRLATNGIDILRLDVVSRDEVAVDDIWVEVPADVSPRLLHELDTVPGVLFLNVAPAYDAEDPVSIMASACAAAARATSLPLARMAGIQGACSISGAHYAVLLSPAGDGALRVTASSAGLTVADVESTQPSLARDAVAARRAMVTRGDAPWRPDAWKPLADVKWAAALPLVPVAGTYAAVLLAMREEDAQFQPGELTRLSQFGQVLAGALRAHGEASGAGSPDAWFQVAEGSLLTGGA